MKRFIARSLSALILLALAAPAVKAADVATPIARIIPARASLPGEDIPGNATHHLAIVIQSGKLSQLIINVPPAVDTPTSIQVTTQAGEKVPVDVTITKGQQIAISFTKPVAVGTTLQVDLQGVRRLTSDNVVVYEISVRQADTKALIAIGAASVRAYGQVP